nr:hypothetical protein [Dechloromonas sp. A34]
MGAPGVPRLPAPGLGAARIDAEGQILVQADGEAGRPARAVLPGRGRQLLVGQPLQVEVKVDFLAVLGRVGADRRGIRRLKLSGPGRPAPGLPIGGTKMGLQCIEQGLCLERCTTGGAELSPGLGPSGVRH